MPGPLYALHMSVPQHLWSLVAPAWIPGTPLLQIVFRTLVVYGFLIAVFRLLGRRSMGQMNVFDLALILVISNAVQNAMVGPDTSLSGGLIAALTLIIVNWIVSLIESRSARARRLLEGSPVLLIHDGNWLHENMRRERVNVEEIKQAMREHGVDDPSGVKLAVLELDGSISIVPTGTEVKRAHRVVKTIHHPG